MRTLEVVEHIRNGSLSVEESTNKILDEAREINKEYHYFNVLAEDAALHRAKELDAQIKKGKAKGKLLGIPISVKDPIFLKGI